MKREFNRDIDFKDEITITGLPDITIGEIWSNVTSAFVDVDPSSTSMGSVARQMKRLKKDIWDPVIFCFVFTPNTLRNLVDMGDGDGSS